MECGQQGQGQSISQRVFALFKLRYIDTGCNLFDAVDSVPDEEFMGDVSKFFRAEAIRTGTEQRLKDLLLGTRSMTKGFVVYQLANRKVSSGVGCGYYDPEGARDGGNIAAQINDYLFEVCFDPDIDARNTEHFLDFCLANFTSGFWSGDDEEGYRPTIGGIANELDAVKLATYWARYGKGIRDQGLTGTRRTITTLNYTASYAHDLPKVFEILDKIQASEEEKVKAKMNAGPAENGAQTASVDKPVEDNASDAVAGG